MVDNSNIRGVTLVLEHTLRLILDILRLRASNKTTAIYTACEYQAGQNYRLIELTKKLLLVRSAELRQELSAEKISCIC